MSHPRDSKPRVVMDPPVHRRPPLGQPSRDIRQTKEYKVAARRWISTIVALPVFMYTSWVLYERTYGNKSQKRLVGSVSRAAETAGDEGRHEK
ncbi:hypothetical protein BDV59DRAFT_206493 [Aspergillus ambiguus]|uniref:uncharacterized protein n=1 Tax=Aspergillus ambiguus TaxID=176160 RepID=UPI003CCE0AEE